MGTDERHEMTEATGWRWVPETVLSEEVLCMCGAEGSGEVHEDWCPHRRVHAALPPAPPEDVERVARAICCPDGECRAAKHDDGFRSGKYILPMPCNWTSHKDEARAALSASAPPAAPADELVAALDFDGEGDAYLNLSGAIIDIERNEGHCDEVSLGTLKRVEDQLYKVLQAVNTEALARHRAQQQEPSHD